MPIFVELLVAQGRAAGRALRAQAFIILVLGPLIFGGLLWIVERWRPFILRPLEAMLSDGTAPGIAAMGLVLLLTAFHLPASRQELFPRRSANVCLDSLPIPEKVRFHAALAAVLGRHGMTLVALLILCHVLAGGTSPASLGLRLHEILAALIPLALVGMILSQLATRLRATGQAQRALPVLIGAAVGLMAAGLGSWLLLPWQASAARVEIVLRELAGFDGPEPAGSDPGLWTMATLLLYGVSFFLFVRYRRRDLEVATTATENALRLGGRIRARLAGLPSLALRSPLRELLVRDLLLVLRRFSPAVDFTALLILTILGVFFGVLPGLGITPDWLPRVLVLGTGLAVLTAVSLVPLLVRHQLSRLWIERSTGVDYQAVARAKVALALVLGLAPASLGAIGLLRFVDVQAVGHLAVVTWIVATLVGLGAYEIATSPILGLAFSAAVAFALSTLFVIYPQVWWIVLLLYLWAAGHLSERAPRLVRLMEVER